MVTVSTPAGLDPRIDIDATMNAGDRGAALQLARGYWVQNPNASAARFLKARADRFWPAERLIEHRVAFLRSFTLEPVLPLLEAEAVLDGCRLATWVGAFNAYGQDILDPASGLYAFAPQTVVLAVQTRDVAPALWRGFAGLSDDAARAEAEEVGRAVVHLVEQLRARTAANILVHGLARPVGSDEGLLDLRRSTGQGDAIQLANAWIREHCRTASGVYFLDYDELQARHGRLGWGDERKWNSTKLPFSVAALGPMAREWWRYLRLLALPPTKVLALDLDNTLWGGTVGEDGIAGVALGNEHPGVHFKALQQAIADVARRGVILAIASKNNPADAFQMINDHPEMVLRSNAFSATRINWEPKVKNLIEIAAELNVDIDSFIFVDDNPAECEAVRRSLPDVEVVELPADPSLYADLIRFHPALERLTVSAEDGERGRFYAQERSRKALESQTESLEDFLTSLDIRITIEPVGPATLARAAQLTQKTNQLNTTTRRFSEAEMEAVVASSARSAWVLRASDRFGDNGIVGFAATRVEGGTLMLDAFLMSCRVIGRGIERAFLAALADHARGRNLTTMDGAFVPTPKNAPAAGIFDSAGFKRIESSAVDELWRLDLTSGAILAPIWITATMHEPSTA